MISYKDNQKCAAGEKAQRSIFHQSVSIGEITAQKNLFFFDGLLYDFFTAKHIPAGNL